MAENIQIFLSYTGFANATPGHFVMLLVGKTRYPRRMLVFHPVTWNLLLVAVPDIAQAMQVPTATWMSVMSQSSTNTAIVIWCIAAAVYERNHT